MQQRGCSRPADRWHRARCAGGCGMELWYVSSAPSAARPLSLMSLSTCDAATVLCAKHADVSVLSANWRQRMDKNRLNVVASAKQGW